MPYLPALDSLKAIAVLMVMLFHAQPPVIKGGFLGVDVFFVLSGFLITALLRDELALSGTLSLRRFYARRALRLMPPLLVLVAIYLLVAPKIWPQHERHFFDSGLTALYLSDYGVAFWSSPKYLRHTWSLAVEEHFYIIWPLVLLMLRRLRTERLLAVLIGIYAAATLWRVYCSETQPWDWVYYRFDTRISGTILGAALAVAWTAGSLPRIEMAWPGLGIIGTAMLWAKWGSGASLQLATLATEVATATMITAIIQNPERTSRLSYSVLPYLGRLSYGVYLYHFPIMLYLRPYSEWALTLLLGAGLSILVAAVSYHSIEAWARSLKRSSGHIDRDADVDVEVVRHP